MRNLLPRYLRDTLAGRPTLNAVAGNAAWLFADNALRLGLGLTVFSWIARYLGPEQYGTLSYVTAFVALFAAFSSLGIDGIVIRELTLRPEKRNELLGSALVLRLLGGVACIGLATLCASLTRQGDGAFLALVGILSAGALFQAFDVAGHWFASQNKAKYAVVAKGTVFVVICAIKIALVYAGAPLQAFVIAAFAEIALGALALTICFQVNYGPFKEWSCRTSVVTSLVREGWPMMFAFLAYTIYARIDQVMLGAFASDREVGIYAASMRIMEVFVALILMLTASLFPTLSRKHHENPDHYFDLYRGVTTLFTWFAIGCLLVTVLVGRPCMHFLFGPAYDASYDVLLVHMIGFVFMANGGLRSSYFTTIGKQKIILTTTLFSAVFNVLMNCWLIPIYGAVGAAWASAATQMVSMLLLNAMFGPSRRIGSIQLAAFNPFLLAGYGKWLNPGLGKTLK